MDGAWSVGSHGRRRNAPSAAGAPCVGRRARRSDDEAALIQATTSHQQRTTGYVEVKVRLPSGP